MAATRHEHQELVDLMHERRLAAVVARAGTMHPPDLADLLAALSLPDQVALLTALPVKNAAHALVEIPAGAARREILDRVGALRAAELVNALEDDDAAQLLAALDPAHQDAILAFAGNRRLAERVRAHDPQVASALMTTRVVVVGAADSIRLATESVRRQANAGDGLQEVWVIDPGRRLCGILSFAQLLLAAPDALVRDVMHPSTLHVRPDEDQRVVAQIVARYNLPSVPVVDASGRLMGRITADDLRDFAADDAGVDLLRFGGVAADGRADRFWRAALRERLPSLYVNLLGAFVAAAVVYLFTGTISRMVTLVVWMPVVAGVGGSAGTQALASAVQRLRGSSAHVRKAWWHVAREAAIGLCTGVAIGAAVAAVAVLLGEPWKVGLVILLAMTGNLMIAGTVGALAPRMLRAVGRDPSLASPVVVSAITDACGFALLLGLAAALLA